ncbi:hypothetical protein MMPV_002138 [Pyropia vietnamensis]
MEAFLDATAAAGWQPIRRHHLQPHPDWRPGGVPARGGDTPGGADGLAADASLEGGGGGGGGGSGGLLGGGGAVPPASVGGGVVGVAAWVPPAAGGEGAASAAVAAGDGVGGAVPPPPPPPRLGGALGTHLPDSPDGEAAVSGPPPPPSPLLAAPVVGTAVPPPVVFPPPPSPLAGAPVKDLDVVLTHSTADFDSLAAAVGLAKLRGPHTMVVCPGGASEAVKRFLSFHRQLLPIMPAKLIDPARLRWVGVVDTTRLEGLGVAASWPAAAEAVTVIDHHVGAVCDIVNEHSRELVVDDVGAVATLIVERLRDAAVDLTPTEATLLALAIHADTGSLTYSSTTGRDAAALAWLMVAQAATQRSIAEYSGAVLSMEQQRLLTVGLGAVVRHRVRGYTVGTVRLRAGRMIRGVNTVTTDLLDITNVDVLLLLFINDGSGGSGEKRSRKGRGRSKSTALESTPPSPAASMLSDPDRLLAISALPEPRPPAPLPAKGAPTAAPGAALVPDPPPPQAAATAAATTATDSTDGGEPPWPRPRTTLIVGRARARVGEAVDLHIPCAALGGGGHRHAASVTVKTRSVAAASAIFARVVDAVIDGLPPPALAADFMTTAVVTVAPDMSMAAAAAVMHDSGHSGLPVVDATGRLRGMLSRSDVRRAAVADDAAVKVRAAAAAAAAAVAAADAAAAASTTASEAAVVAAAGGNGDTAGGEEEAASATGPGQNDAVAVVAAATAATPLPGASPPAEVAASAMVVAAGGAHAHTHAQGLNRPVSAWMRAQLVTVTPDTPLHDVQELMVSRNVGRVPVLGGPDGAALVGIISGTDVLKQLRLWEN